VVVLQVLHRIGSASALSQNLGTVTFTVIVNRIT